MPVLTVVVLFQAIRQNQRIKVVKTTQIGNSEQNMLDIYSFLFRVILLYKFFYKAFWRYVLDKSSCKRRFYRSHTFLGICRVSGCLKVWGIASELPKARKQSKRKRCLKNGLVYFKLVRCLHSRTHLDSILLQYLILTVSFLMLRKLSEKSDLSGSVRTAAKSCVKVIMNSYVTCVPHPLPPPGKFIHSIHLLT